MSRMTTDEKQARRSGSMPGYFADETMTKALPTRISAAKGSRSASPRTVGSVAAGSESVLPVARPRPGKCLREVATAPFCMPRTKA